MTMGINQRAFNTNRHSLKYNTLRGKKIYKYSEPLKFSQGQNKDMSDPTVTSFLLIRLRKKFQIKT